MKVKKAKAAKNQVVEEENENDSAIDEASSDEEEVMEEDTDTDEANDTEESAIEKESKNEDSENDSSDDEDSDEDPTAAEFDTAVEDMDAGGESSDEAPEELSSKVKSPPKVSAKKETVEKKPVEEKATRDPNTPAYDKKDELKTVFCGNIPNAPNVNETRIKDLFSQYGTVRSVRFRSESGKKIFSKKVKKDCTSFIAYIVYDKIEDAEKSIQLNGFKLLTNHLRVNLANKKSEAFSSKGTIFVGNLLFEATESEVHEYFSQVGPIHYVRKIANKGIAYVSFEKGVNISTALKLNGKPFKGRPLRISRCESRDKQDKKKMFKKDEKTGKFVKQKVKKPHKMSEEKFMAGKNNNNPIIKKIKESQKAKFNKFSEKKQLSKKELFRQGGKMDQNQREEIREKSKKKQKFFGAKIDGIEKKSKKTKVSKSIKEQKVIAKKLKSAAGRAN